MRCTVFDQLVLFLETFTHCKGAGLVGCHQTPDLHRPQNIPLYQTTISRKISHVTRPDQTDPADLGACVCSIFDIFHERHFSFEMKTSAPASKDPWPGWRFFSARD